MKSFKNTKDINKKLKSGLLNKLKGNTDIGDGDGDGDEGVPRMVMSNKSKVRIENEC